MSFLEDLWIKLGITKRSRILRKGDRRRINRRWERTSEYRQSPEYQARMKKDRRKGQRREL